MHEATQDSVRTNVIITYLAEMLKGVAEDGIPIKGVFAWCLTDNWEWNAGFSGMCLTRLVCSASTCDRL
jgi:beta-glucosidase